MTFKDLEQSVIEDVTRIRNHPLVPKSVPIYGFYYDVKIGKLIEVKQATEVGKSSWFYIIFTFIITF